MEMASDIEVTYFSKTAVPFLWVDLSIREKFYAMKGLLRETALWLLRFPIDLVIAAIAVPSALVLLMYRRGGVMRLKLTTRMLKKIGIFPIRNHYYEPLFDETQLSKSLSDDDRHLPGIELNDAGQLELLKRFNSTSELVAMNWNGPSSSVEQFCVLNGNFASGDAEFLYQFVRTIKPGKIIEVGSGHSTKVARKALEKNREEGVTATQVCIEPYEQSWLEGLGQIEVIRKRLEECEFDWGSALGPGDLLFIDSSHMIRPQGDVLKEYLEILPQLASGVYVHIHDIFTPKDYPRSWIVDHMLFWNEQYLLEALLSNGARYEVVGALNYLKHHYYDEFKGVSPYLTPEREPGSFYLRVR